MATTIKAGNVTGGTSIASDGTGILELKTGTGSGTTALTLDASQNATFAGTVNINGVSGSIYPLSLGTYIDIYPTYTANISGTTMDVTVAPVLGDIQVGQLITGTGVTANTRIEAFGTGTGGIGTYLVSETQTVASTTINTAGMEYQNIPSWVRRVTVMFRNVVLSGTNSLLLQLGDAGGIETTGYSAGAGRLGSSNNVSTARYTNGFGFNNATSSILDGSFVLTYINTRTYTATGIITGPTDVICSCAGSKQTSATMDRIRITRSGTDFFSNGNVNIMWE